VLVSELDEPSWRSGPRGMCQSTAPECSRAWESLLRALASGLALELRAEARKWCQRELEWTKLDLGRARSALELC
jgi:hypothetical protein